MKRFAYFSAMSRCRRAGVRRMRPTRRVGERGEDMVATIIEVAKLAGVSPTTVSRAFGRPDLLNPDTRAAVLSAADQLGYTPNRAAKGLVTGKTGNVGILVPDIVNPF